MNPQNAIELTAEANEALRLAEEMSQANRTDTPMDRRGRYRSMPWLVAIASILRSYGYGPFDADASGRWQLPVYDGDRPADLTDEQIGNAATYAPEYRNRCRTNDQFATLVREAILDRGRGDGYAAGVRATHREVHEALAGEPCPTCQWCRKDGA